MAAATFCARVAAAARAPVNKKMLKQTRELRVQKPFVELSGRIRSLCAKHFKAHNDAKVRKISILNSTKPQEIGDRPGDRHSDLCVTFR